MVNFSDEAILCGCENSLEDYPFCFRENGKKYYTCTTTGRMEEVKIPKATHEVHLWAWWADGPARLVSAFSVGVFG